MYTLGIHFANLAIDLFRLILFIVLFQEKQAEYMVRVAPGQGICLCLSLFK